MVPIIEGDITECIRQSDLVVTLQTSAIFEALLQKKKLLILDYAFSNKLSDYI